MANTIDDPTGPEPVDYVASAHDEALETERLALEDENERLPWLESADDDYADESVDDNRRLIAFVLMGLIALAAIVGGLWWATNRTPDPALVADGSTIAAPEGPYKEAPKDPGGKKIAGTGDTSFAVSEGHNRPAQLGSGTPPSPSVDLGKPGVAAPAAPQGGVGVQVGAYSSQASAEAAWSRLAQQHGALSGVSHRVQQGQADIGTVYRLQAVTSDSAAAQALCGKLKSSGLACQVK